MRIFLFTFPDYTGRKEEDEGELKPALLLIRFHYTSFVLSKLANPYRDGYYQTW
jgi:hypothetical protein